MNADNLIVSFFNTLPLGAITPEVVAALGGGGVGVIASYAVGVMVCRSAITSQSSPNKSGKLGFTVFLSLACAVITVALLVAYRFDFMSIPWMVALALTLALSFYAFATK